MFSVPERTSVTFICRNGKLFSCFLKIGLAVWGVPFSFLLLPSCVGCLRTVRGAHRAPVLLHATRTRPPSHRDAFTVRSDGGFLYSVS